MYTASHYRFIDKDRIQCRLCPHFCVLKEGERGICMARVHKEGKLLTESYGILSAISVDPIEKKPLYHFLPGTSIFSIGSFGCNLSCTFCQNCDISQVEAGIYSRYAPRDPEIIVEEALRQQGNIGLAYTYNEPGINFEYMLECAAYVRERQLKNVMVTNGFINPEPLNELIPVTDAFNVDLKSFRDEFYRKITGGRLKPVLRTIEKIAGSDSHLELTFLIIPGLNDSEPEWEGMISWISDHCGPDIVLHVSRYFPHYKLNHPATPIHTLEQFVHLAREKIRYVYPGNTHNQMDSSTYCPECGTRLIDRSGYRSRVTGIDPGGHCTRCQTEIYGVFKAA